MSCVVWPACSLACNLPSARRTAKAVQGAPSGLQKAENRALPKEQNRRQTLPNPGRGQNVKHAITGCLPPNQLPVSPHKGAAGTEKSSPETRRPLDAGDEGQQDGGQLNIEESNP